MVAECEAEHGWAQTRWYETRSDDAGRAAAEHALAAAPAVVMAAGGDGTVRVVAEVMQGTGIPVALVPLCTGNLLARDVGAPLNDIAACVSAAFAGEDRPVDVGVAELEDESGARRSHTFMVMAGIGLDAEMAESTSTIATRPTGRFGWARIGTRLTLQGLARRSPLSRRLLQQTPDLHALAYVQGTRFEARFDAPHLIELDGDSFGHITRVRVSVRPGALHIRVPVQTIVVEKSTTARQRPSRP